MANTSGRSVLGFIEALTSKTPGPPRSLRVPGPQVLSEKSMTWAVPWLSMANRSCVVPQGLVIVMALVAEGTRRSSSCSNCGRTARVRPVPGWVLEVPRSQFSKRSMGIS
jgi:hypothetical protein